MIPPHEMTRDQRRNKVLCFLDEAEFFARMYREKAEDCHKRDAQRAQEYTALSVSWAKEAQRIKGLEILK